MNKLDAGKRLNAISIELRACHIALGDLLASEQQKRTETIKTQLGMGASVNAADREASINAIGDAVRISKTRGEILALQEEQDHIRFMIKYNISEAI